MLQRRSVRLASYADQEPQRSMATKSSVESTIVPGFVALVISPRLGAFGDVQSLYIWDACKAFWALLSLYAAKYFVGVEYILNINDPNSKYQVKP